MIIAWSSAWNTCFSCFSSWWLPSSWSSSPSAKSFQKKTSKTLSKWKFSHKMNSTKLVCVDAINSKLNPIKSQFNGLSYFIIDSEDSTRSLLKTKIWILCQWKFFISREVIAGFHYTQLFNNGVLIKIEQYLLFKIQSKLQYFKRYSV